MSKITLAHGGGGALMHRLIDEVILRYAGNPILRQLTDAALLNVQGKTVAFTTDSYVVTPLFFPGSDIGRMAVYGTVNDLAVCGATPLFISSGLIIEEGLDIAVMRDVVGSMQRAAADAAVMLVTGDIKVVQRGKCDGLYINTSGIGLLKRRIVLSRDRIRVGDKVIISGSIGDHGISVLAAREGINLKGALRSDAAPLHKLIAAIMPIHGLRFMRDPTRGGLAATLNEITAGRRFGITLFEDRIVLKPAVRTAVELLGLDPLSIANEGKVVVIASAHSAKKIVAAMRRNKDGRQARIIGEVTADHRGTVVLRTRIGGMRIVDMPSGELLPRIC